MLTFDGVNRPIDRLSDKNQELYFSKPTGVLGYKVASLVKNSPPLDSNSIYCNLLQCEHFSATSCAVLTSKEELVGFVSGYLIPSVTANKHSETLFVWQVAVDTSQRGKNLGQQMMLHILSREVCNNVKYLETTVTGNNAASSAMFSKLAVALKAPDLEKSVLFDKQKHFLGLHDSEILFRIGPFNSHPQTT